MKSNSLPWIYFDKIKFISFEVYLFHVLDNNNTVANLQINDKTLNVLKIIFFFHLQFFRTCDSFIASCSHLNSFSFWHCCWIFHIYIKERNQIEKVKKKYKEEAEEKVCAFLIASTYKCNFTVVLCGTWTRSSECDRHRWTTVKKKIIKRKKTINISEDFARFTILYIFLSIYFVIGF